jgi:hypothetical protein
MGGAGGNMFYKHTCDFSSHPSYTFSFFFLSSTSNLFAIFLQVTCTKHESQRTYVLHSSHFLLGFFRVCVLSFFFHFGC